MKPEIGITPDNLTRIAQAMNGFLADEVLLYIKTRNAHWNVEGPQFHEKHKFFEAQYEALDEIMDDVAERIRSLGHYAAATMKDYSEASREKNDAEGFTRELLADHESIIIRLRESIDPFSKMNDFGTSDFITGLMEKHEKMAWMLRAHLK